jgi:hypothetical protein
LKTGSGRSLAKNSGNSKVIRPAGLSWITVGNIAITLIDPVAVLVAVRFVFRCGFVHHYAAIVFCNPP